MEEDIKLLARADPAFQESLQSEVEPDPMEGEQTWPTDEELREAEGGILKDFILSTLAKVPQSLHSEHDFPI